MEGESDSQGGAVGKILNIHKPIGWTSFDVVKLVRHFVGIRKVGHAGSLDPFAEGVLLVCIGSATKEVPRLMGLPKTYSGTIQLGLLTDTLDPTGKVEGQKEPRRTISTASIRDAMCKFVGEIEQIPPMYSAVKVEGARLYKLARAREKAERKPRKVSVYSFIPDKVFPPFIQFSLSCSRGTYVRSLAKDLGSELGCDAIVKTLKRGRIGFYDTKDSIHLDQLSDQNVSRTIDC